MKLRITTLCENTAGMINVLAEFGWSVLVETDDVNILFDTGPSISVCHNADILGVDLSKVDKIVLSHGHFDHTGGLRQILRKMRKETEIIAHPHVWAIRYNCKDQNKRFTGIPFQRQELENFGAIFKLTAEPTKIADSIMTTGEIPMVTDFENVAPLKPDGSGWFIQEDTALKPDKVLDDQALIINTELGLVIVLGCSHRGIINTLYHAQQLTGKKEIHTVLGGSHLIGASEERVRLTIAALKELRIQRLGLCHCTSLPVTARLAQEFGDKFFFNNTGTVLELP